MGGSAGLPSSIFPVGNLPRPGFSGAIRTGAGWVVPRRGSAERLLNEPPGPRSLLPVRDRRSASAERSPMSMAHCPVHTPSLRWSEVGSRAIQAVARGPELSPIGGTCFSLSAVPFRRCYSPRSHTHRCQRRQTRASCITAALPTSSRPGRPSRGAGARGSSTAPGSRAWSRPPATSGPPRA